MTKDKLKLAQSIDIQLTSIQNEIKNIEGLLAKELCINIWNSEYSTHCTRSFNQEEIKKILQNKKDSLLKEQHFLEGQFALI